jgi:hypothetical protein
MRLRGSVWDGVAKRAEDSRSGKFAEDVGKGLTLARWFVIAVLAFLVIAWVLAKLNVI